MLILSFRMDLEASLGSCPLLNLSSLVLSPLEKTLTPVAEPPSVVIVKAPSVDPSASSVLFGFTEKVLPVPTRSSTSISSLISAEDLSSTFCKPTSPLSYLLKDPLTELVKAECVPLCVIALNQK